MKNRHTRAQTAAGAGNADAVSAGGARTMNRGTFLRFAVAGVAAGTLAPAVANLSASGAQAAQPGIAVVPVPGSGGIPAGPATHGYLAGDLLAWLPAEDANARHFRCLIPRAKRIPAFAATQAHPTLDPRTELLSLAPDYAGDIYEGRVRPIGDEAQVYTQRFWPYIDIYGSWHGQLVASVPDDVVRNPDAPGRTYGVVDIPNPGWTEAAHKNGARTLGGWFWPRPDRFENFVQRDPDGSFPVGRKLVEIKQYFGFDGYFINQEDAVSPAQIKALFAMFRYMKSLDADLYLQYYDADLPDSGELDYQNEINERNVGSLGTVSDPVADSIFINYGWPYTDKDLSGSAATVAGRGFDPRKAAFASTECQQGGFNPAEDFSSVASPGHAAPVSWALFVENQIWADAAKEGITATAGGRAQYRDLERKFWSGPAGDPSQSGRTEARKPPYRTDVLNYKVWDGVAHSIVEKSAISALPLVTNFNIGVGTHFAVAGETVGSKAWNNAGIADVAPTWQYWTEHAGGATSVFALDESVAWEGGHSLHVTGQAAEGQSVTVHLFKTDLPVPPGTTASLRMLGFPAAAAAELGLTFKDAPNAPLWLPLQGKGQPRSADGGWSTAESNVSRFNKRQLARISLRFSAGQDGRLDFRLGQFALASNRRQQPGKPRGFTVERVERASEVAGVYLAWQLSADAYAYDVFTAGHGGKRNWLGRVHRDVFYAGGVPVPANGQLGFELVPISVDGSRGTAAVAAAAAP